jgi:hypothetical protein
MIIAILITFLLACQAGQKVLDSCSQRCVCTSRGTLVNCTRIRQEFTSMTTAERERHVRVVKTASNDTRFVKYNKPLFYYYNLKIA